MDFSTGFANPELREELLAKENLKGLESVLNDEAREFNRLKRLKRAKQLNLGRRVPAEELEDVFNEVSGKVDNFLDTSRTGQPGVHYSKLTDLNLENLSTIGGHAYLPAGAVLATYAGSQGDYNTAMASLVIGGIGFLLGRFCYSMNKCDGLDTAENKLYLSNPRRAVLIPEVAHGYTAHLQHVNGMDKQEYSIFTHGHARGVSKSIAKKYMEEEDTPGFMYNVLKQSVQEIKSSYLWLCRQFGEKPNPMLMNDSSGKLIPELDNVYRPEPTADAMGNAIFALNEAKGGNPKIYREMFHQAKNA